jgi:hypothetical protein
MSHSLTHKLCLPAQNNNTNLEGIVKLLIGCFLFAQHDEDGSLKQFIELLLL